jgi:hypothetical protein
MRTEIAAAMPETAPVGPEPEQLLSEPIVSESLETNVAKPVVPQTPNVALKATPAKTNATLAKKTPAAATTPSGPREGSKTSHVIELLKRKAA